MSVVAQAEKAGVVEKIKTHVQDASVVVFTDFRGLTVGEVSKLRQLLKTEGAKMSVYKNTLTRRALADLEISYPEAFLVGPSAVVHARGDAARVAKVLVNYAKDVDRLKIKGGLLDKGILQDSDVQALAELPSREELLSKLVGTLQAPITKLVVTLSGPTRGLVYVLNAIKETKSEVNEK